MAHIHRVADITSVSSWFKMILHRSLSVLPPDRCHHPVLLCSVHILLSLYVARAALLLASSLLASQFWPRPRTQVFLKMRQARNNGRSIIIWYIITDEITTTRQLLQVYGQTLFKTEQKDRRQRDALRLNEVDEPEDTPPSCPCLAKLPG